MWRDVVTNDIFEDEDELYDHVASRVDDIDIVEVMQLMDLRKLFTHLDEETQLDILSRAQGNYMAHYIENMEE